MTSVLFTGGDPMIMGEPVLRRYIEPLLRLEQLESIRIGTKALAYWPQQFVTDPDADDMLRLFEQVVRVGQEPGLHGATSRTRASSSRRWSPRRCAASATPARSSAPRPR